MLEHLPIQNRKNGFSLAGSRIEIASNDMVLQYKEKKEIKSNDKQFYGGAFGRNGSIPYDLSPNKRL